MHFGGDTDSDDDDVINQGYNAAANAQPAPPLLNDNPILGVVNIVPLAGPQPNIQIPNIAPNAHQVINAIAAINADHAAQLNYQFLLHLRDANMLALTPMLEDRFYGAAADQLIQPKHDLRIPDADLGVLRRSYGNDALLAAQKLRVVASLLFVKDIAESSKFTCEGIIREMQFEENFYRLVIQYADAEPPIHAQSFRLVICRAAEYRDATRPFQYYVASVTVIENSEEGRRLRVFVPHRDGNTPRFQINQRVRILVPPSPRVFEGHMLVCHALENDHDFREKYFGSPPDNPPNIPFRDMRNDLPAMNETQRHTIKACLLFNDPRYPLAIQGPPGTGKTSLLAKLVFIILHYFEKEFCKAPKILIVAPSNQAANVIAQKLVADPGINNNRIFRVFAPSYDPNKAPRELLQVSNSDPNTRRFCVSASEKELKKYDVYIATIGASPYLSRLGRRYFTHILVDEGGQATELDTLLPFVMFSDLTTRVVVCGDPKQLRTFFPDGVIGQRQFNVNMSTLERLFNNPAYVMDILKFMLTRNYRSLLALILPFSIMFYESRIRAAGDDASLAHKRKFIGTAILGGQPTPIRFHVSRSPETAEDVEGYQNDDERRVYDHTSFFNENEVEGVAYYVQRCIENGVPQTDIGVVIPYRAQIAHVNRRLAAEGYADVYVETVERFQGDQRPVIILSTVRSAHIGFLSDYRRLNVSISRAECMLIIVGNLELLIQNPFWRWYAGYLNGLGVIHDPQCPDGPDAEQVRNYWAGRIAALGN